MQWNCSPAAGLFVDVESGTELMQLSVRRDVGDLSVAHKLWDLMRRGNRYARKGPVSNTVGCRGQKPNGDPSRRTAEWELFSLFAGRCWLAAGVGATRTGLHAFGESRCALCAKHSLVLLFEAERKWGAECKSGTPVVYPTASCTCCSVVNKWGTAALYPAMVLRRTRAST